MSSNWRHLSPSKQLGVVRSRWRRFLGIVDGWVSRRCILWVFSVLAYIPNARGVT